jgi:hypothetical protein
LTAGRTGRRFAGKKLPEYRTRWGTRHEEVFSPAISAVMINLYAPHVPLSNRKWQAVLKGDDPLLAEREGEAWNTG